MPSALVTGASRGIGRGVAAALADAGYRVFATGRTIAQASLPESVVRIPCDHTRDHETEGAFRRLASEVGDLDVLVNCCWGGYERMVENGSFTWPLPFWEQPMHRWTGMMDAGVRAAFVASQFAARMMIPRKQGLIVNLSFWAARKRIGNVIYGISKTATDKMTQDMAEELAPHGVTAISLYPGLVRTEAVLEAAKGGYLDLSNSESPEFTGRVIAALDGEEDRMRWNGKVFVHSVGSERNHAQRDLAKRKSRVIDLRGREPGGEPGAPRRLSLRSLSGQPGNRQCGIPGVRNAWLPRHRLRRVWPEFRNASSTMDQACGAAGGALCG